VHGAQIDIPAPFRNVMRVANAVSRLRLFAANFTLLCHDCCRILSWLVAKPLFYRTQARFSYSGEYGITQSFLGAIPRGPEATMSAKGKKTFIENTLVLALMGVLAGAIGGLAVGVVTSPKAASTPSTAR
jgi:hypothetical protein